MKQVILLTIISLFFSCSTKKELSTQPYVMWIKGIKVDCTGVGPMKCLLVQKSENIESGKWEYFYSEIEGFKFQNGTRSKILVSEKKVEDSQVPADGSSIKYKLIEVLEKIPEPIFSLHDIWALETIEQQPIEKPRSNSGMHIPSIELNLVEMQIMGTDGCNQFFGPIKKVGDNTIEFGNLGASMKLCVDMKLPDRFNQSLVKVTQYERNGMKLLFKDSFGTELLQFKKVD